MPKLTTTFRKGAPCKGSPHMGTPDIVVITTTATIAIRISIVITIALMFIAV